MRALLICDRSFAAREHALLRRLEVGLLDEGVRITRSAPASHAHLLMLGPSATVPYEDRGLALTRRLRTAALVHELTDDSGPLSETMASLPIDVVHAFGEECWPTALGVASATGAALAVELWSGFALRESRSLEREAARFVAEGGRAVWLAPDAAIVHAAAHQGLTWPVRLAPWGVHASDEFIRDAPADGPLSLCAICRPNADPAALRAFLNGLDQASRDEREILAFIDHAAIANEPELWRLADNLGLLRTLSAIENLEAQRELILHADALALPDPAGEHRSITLDAMARGMTVIAQPDPLNSDLIDGRTAWIVDQPTPDAWAALIRRVRDDREAQAALAVSARAYVREHHLASAHVREVIAAYQSIVAEPITFPPGAA